MINPDWTHHTANPEENPPELSLCSPGVLPSPRALSPAPVSSLELGTTSPSPEVRMLLQVCGEAAALLFPPGK